ncbi:MAG: transposase [bacterium]
MQTQPKLILILDSIDLSEIYNAIGSKSNKGPTGYNPEAILRALLAQQIENIPTRAALVRRLKSDPHRTMMLKLSFQLTKGMLNNHQRAHQC